jgi:hypothetical protein
MIMGFEQVAFWGYFYMKNIHSVQANAKGFLNRSV